MEDSSLSTPRQTLTIKEVATLLGFSTNSIYKFVKEGRIQAERLGRGRFRIPRAEIERFLGHTRHPGHEKGPVNAVAPASTQETIKKEPEEAMATPIPHVEPVGLHTAGAPDVFDWFVGIALMLLGLAFLLLPGREDSLLTSTFALRLAGGSLLGIGLAFLWLDATGVENRVLSILLHVGAVLSGIFVMMPYYVSLGDWYGLTRTLGLVAILLISFLFPRLSSEKRFAFLIVILGTIAVGFVVFDPARLAWQPAVSLVRAAPSTLAILWAAILLGFLATYRWVSLQAPRVRLLFFGCSGIIILAFATWGVVRGAWDQVAFTLTLGTFAFFAPLSERFERAPVRRRPIITLVFLWVGGLLAAAVLTTRVIHVHLEQSYLRATDLVAERGRETILDQLNTARRAVDGSASDPALAAALPRGDPETLGAFARSAYFVSGTALAQVFIMDREGNVQGQYPVGTPSVSEQEAVRAAASAVATSGKAQISETVLPASPGPPITVLVTPILGRDGTVLGSLGGPLNHGELQNALSRLRFNDEGVIFAMTKSGVVMLHGDAARVGTTVDTDTHVAANQEGVADGTDGTVLRATRSIPETGWTVVAEYPLAGAYELGNLLVILTLVGVLGGVSGTLAVAVRLLRSKLRIAVPPGEG